MTLLSSYLKPNLGYLLHGFKPQKMLKIIEDEAPAAPSEPKSPLHAEMEKARAENIRLRSEAIGRTGKDPASIGPNHGLALAIADHMASNGMHVVVPKAVVEKDPKAEAIAASTNVTDRLRFGYHHGGRVKGQPSTSKPFKEVLPPNMAVDHIKRIADIAASKGITPDHFANNSAPTALKSVFDEFHEQTGHKVLSRGAIPHRQRPEALSSDSERHLVLGAMSQDSFNPTAEKKARKEAATDEYHDRLIKEHLPTLQHAMGLLKKANMPVTGAHKQALVQGLAHLRKADHSPMNANTALVGGVQSYIAHAKHTQKAIGEVPDFAEHLGNHIDDYHQQNPPGPVPDEYAVNSLHKGTMRASYERLLHRRTTYGLAQPDPENPEKPREQSASELAQGKHGTGTIPSVNTEPLKLDPHHYFSKVGEFAHTLTQHGYLSGAVSDAIKHVTKTFEEKHPYGTNEEFSTHLHDHLFDKEQGYLAPRKPGAVRASKLETSYGTLLGELHSKISRSGLDLSADTHNSESRNEGAKLKDKGYADRDIHQILKGATDAFIGDGGHKAHHDNPEGEYGDFLRRHIDSYTSTHPKPEPNIRSVVPEESKEALVDIPHEVDRRTGKIVYKGVNHPETGEPLEVAGYTHGGRFVPMTAEQRLLHGNKLDVLQGKEDEKGKPEAVRPVHLTAIPKRKMPRTPSETFDMETVEGQRRAAEAAKATPSALPNQRAVARSTRRSLRANALSNAAGAKQKVRSIWDVPDADLESAANAVVPKKLDPSLELATVLSKIPGKIDTSAMSPEIQAHYNRQPSTPGISPSLVLSKSPTISGRRHREILDHNAHVALPTDEKAHVIAHHVLQDPEVIDDIKEFGGTSEHLLNISVDHHLKQLGLPAIATHLATGQDVEQHLRDWKAGPVRKSPEELKALPHEERAKTVAGYKAEDREEQAKEHNKDIGTREVRLRRLHAGLLQDPQHHKDAHAKIIEHKKALQEDLKHIDRHEKAANDAGEAGIPSELESSRRKIKSQLATIQSGLKNPHSEDFAQAHLNAHRETLKHELQDKSTQADVDSANDILSDIPPEDPDEHPRFTVARNYAKAKLAKHAGKIPTWAPDRHSGDIDTVGAITGLLHKYKGDDLGKTSSEKLLRGLPELSGVLKDYVSSPDHKQRQEHKWV